MFSVFRPGWDGASDRRNFIAVGAATALLIGALLFVGAILLTDLLSAHPESRTLTLTGFWSIVLGFLAEAVCIVFGWKEMNGFRRAKEQTDELFSMTDMLQSADGYDDAAAVLNSASLRLLPEFGVALYVFNNSRDRLDLTSTCNMPDEYLAADALAPSNCWALKRGKPHINAPIMGGSLCCSHHGSAAAALEIPMMARGSVYGLLVFAARVDFKSYAKLVSISRMGQALADSISLALSNIALREKLRTQSLRDPLTGLYNRRYMEDTLERYVSLAERSGTPTSILMIDLDNFKRLNDDFGHAKGDAVLRDVAVQLVGGVRPSDVVCRYGGEELMVILPDCNIEDARLKAESLRQRVEGLSQVHGADISASIGLASIPETSTSVADLIAMADNALYAAKSAGKNRIVCAERRAAREDCQPRLAATS